MIREPWLDGPPEQLSLDDFHIDCEEPCADVPEGVECDETPRIGVTPMDLSDDGTEGRCPVCLHWHSTRPA